MGKRCFLTNIHNGLVENRGRGKNKKFPQTAEVNDGEPHGLRLSTGCGGEQW
jgi:hypothetical protein